ncbi:MAG: hypothetical protein K2X77_10405 [Candidatus Obscuribacterales bacterium]|jgi:hypothetical protein|nr:hypothetical protein [Candidatus Obscuribacterales bacterium]
MEQLQPASQTIPTEMRDALLPDEHVLFVAHSDLQKVRVFLVITLIMFFGVCTVLGVVGAPDIDFTDFAIVLIKSLPFQFAFLLTIFAQIVFFQMHRTCVYVITDRKFRWGYRIWRLKKFIINTLEIDPTTTATAKGSDLVLKSRSKSVRLGPIKEVSDLAKNLNLSAEKSKQAP